MRIVTWNCCRGPANKKIAALDTLCPDLAIIAESSKPADGSPKALWFPSGVSKLGIQVKAWGDYQLERRPPADLPNCVVPVRVIGPKTFNLLAVWTWPAPSYIKAMMNALEAYAGLLDSGQAIVAGDFNGNPGFDKPGARMKWGSAFAKLHAAGLVSSYHHANSAKFGEEPHATHHFQRKPDRPFHIDFCFVPKDWVGAGLTSEILSDEYWRALSDHFPIVTETAS